MFGAPPVGHVMDPQFKPLFFGVMEICMQVQVCSISMEDLGAYTRSLDTYFL